VTQEPKVSVGSAFGVEHLNTREVGVQKRLHCIEDLLVRRFRPLSGHQLRGNLLKALRRFQLHREHLLALSPRLIGSI
jgi:hypothetical protein